MIAQLAFASLTRRPLRTALTALGIAIAVASTVVFLSLGEGLRSAFDESLEGLGPEIQVTFGAFDSRSLGSIPQMPLHYLESLEADADAYGIAKLTPVLVYMRGSLAAASAFMFYGIPIDTDLQRVYRDFRLVEGRGLEARVPETREENSRRAPILGEAVVGVQAAQRSNIAVGDELRLNPNAAFEVVGIGSSEGGLLDNAILVPLEPLQTALGAEERISFVMLGLENPAAATTTARQLDAAYPDLGFQTREDLSSIFDRAVQVTDVVRLGISAIALVVGAIAVANTMLMSVFERTREFGVVRAVGARPRFLVALVLLEAVMLAVVGAVVGVVIGFAAAAVVNHLAFDVVGLDVAIITPQLVAFAVAVAAGMGLLSGIVPAERAARVPIAVAVARE